MIDENEWRSVLQVAKDGTFSQAAKHLFVSQPSLSQCIKKIERELGMQIFDRSHVPLELTEAGKVYVEAAREMQRLHQSILRRVDDLTALRTGQVRVGSSRTRSVCLLTKAIVAFHQRYPGIQISVVEGSTARLQEHVLDGTVDFSLLYEPLDTGLFQWMPLMEESVLLAVPAEHPLAREYEGVQPEPYPKISFGRLRDEPYIALKPARRMSKIFSELCEKTGISPTVVFEANSILSAAELCSYGMGVTLVTDMVAKYDHGRPRPIIFEIAEAVGPRRLVAAYGKQHALSCAARVFLEFIRA